MAPEDTDTWLEHLTEAECWRLMDEEPVGRVGIVADSAPEVYPVNHVVDRGTIVFRTDPGTKLAGLARTPSVCFQVDGFDPDRRSGWSVLVKGRAGEVHDPEERHRITQLPVDYWSIGPKAHWIRIEPAEVTGRRIRHGAETGDAPG